MTIPRASYPRLVSAAASLAITGLIVFSPMQAGASQMTCMCQKQLVCGADSCDDAEHPDCAATEIKITLSPPGISLCKAGSCLAGKAEVAGKAGTAALLHGSYILSTEPGRNPTDVMALIDPELGPGMLQIADEEGVSQYSIICQPAEN